MSELKKYPGHSVSLYIDKCTGCTHCLRRCPTEAIRIRGGKAEINASICIDCGECIRTCPQHAKKATCDSLDKIFEYKYKIALPPPSFYGQFDRLGHINYMLQALLDFGFDDVYEVARAAEIVSGYTRRYMNRPDVPKPLISSACPAVVKLIQHQFPDLIDNISPLLSPVDIAASNARREALHKHPELKSEDIGICFISPCPSKVSYLKDMAAKGKSDVDVIVSMNELYFALVGKMKKVVKPEIETEAGFVGVNWANSGGEASAVSNDKYLAADGIESVKHILEKIANGSFPELEFVELDACHGGCIGGVMSVENGFVTKARLQTIKSYLPNIRAWNETDTGTDVPENYMNTEPLEQLRNTNWPTNMAQAFKNRVAMQKLAEQLPGIDCGACGSPTCFAFAKDVVMGRVSKDECVVLKCRGAKQEEQANDCSETD